jgi:arylsulfatase A
MTTLGSVPAMENWSDPQKRVDAQLRYPLNPHYAVTLTARDHTAAVERYGKPTFRPEFHLRGKRELLMATRFLPLSYLRSLRAAVAVAVLAISGGFAIIGRAAENRPPNVLYIMADDLGYGDIGPFRQKKIRTPHLDRLAAEGTCFDQFYPGAAVCSPTRSVLMTGQHTGHTRVRGNSGRAGLKRVPLELDDFTVAEVLKSAGYATAVAGKWGLGEPGTTGIPSRQGFDLFFGYLNNNLAEFYFPEKIWKNETEITLPGNASGKREQYSNDLMTDEAIAFMAANRTQPFFLYLAYTLPHNLLEVPVDSLAEYAGRFPEPVGAKDRNKPVPPQPRATFAAMVTRLDREVGRVLAQLRTLGLKENTVVFFCSDNGAPERVGLPAFFGSNGSFRGSKGTLYEGGIRTAMIVRWPGKIAAGRRSDVPWGGWDFLPTAAALAGVTAPAGVDGMDVMAMLRGGAPVRERTFYWEHHEGGFAQAVRIGDLKAIRRRATGAIEVYNLRADPGETRNIAAGEPSFLARATEVFRTARTESKHWPLAAATSNAH